MLHNTIGVSATLFSCAGLEGGLLSAAEHMSALPGLGEFRDPRALDGVRRRVHGLCHLLLCEDREIGHETDRTEVVYMICRSIFNSFIAGKRTGATGLSPQRQSPPALEGVEGRR